ncbi:MAG TPA: class I SAM-dependent methyltransferase, partial [Gemmatimonadales bacterium]|nr:class I SAM-dependent methyltransferase [Gemmatimonadales bacterium]
MVHNLALALHGRPLALPDFPEDRGVKGLGMSDWAGYAEPLAAKLDYVNTFYHREPRLDITDLPAEMEGRYRFLLSSDVFEHIPPAGLEAAFRNSRRLLADDGFFV